MVHEDPSTEATQKLPKERMFQKKSIGKKRFAIAMTLGLFAIGLGDQAEGYVKDAEGVLRCESEAKNDAVLSAYEEYVNERNKSGNVCYKESDEGSLMDFLEYLTTMEAPANGPRYPAEREERFKIMKSKSTLLKYIFIDGAGFGIKLVDNYGERWGEIMPGVLTKFGMGMSYWATDALLGYFSNPPENKEDFEVWVRITCGMANHGKVSGFGKEGPKLLVEEILKSRMDKKLEDVDGVTKTNFGLDWAKEQYKLFEGPNLKSMRCGIEKAGETPLWFCTKEDLEEERNNAQLKSDYGKGEEGVRLNEEEKHALGMIARSIKICRSYFETEGKGGKSGDEEMIKRLGEGVLMKLWEYGEEMCLETIMSYAAWLRYWGIKYIDTGDGARYRGECKVFDKEAFRKAVNGKDKDRMIRVLRYLTFMGYKPESLSLMKLLMRTELTEDKNLAPYREKWRDAANYEGNAIF
ncbi:MAG: hypothetical protein LBJ16_01600 [Holosporaceae bacterium]|nr:hypothetical protein [Holosporaceae bacterium]